MPRSDRKKPTLRERARAHASRSVTYGMGILAASVEGYLAGYRANRMTKAERAVVEAAKIVASKWSIGNECRLLKAVDNLERAKGRK